MAVRPGAEPTVPRSARRPDRPPPPFVVLPELAVGVDDGRELLDDSGERDPGDGEAELAGDSLLRLPAH